MMFDLCLNTQVSDSGPHAPLVFGMIIDIGPIYPAMA